MPPDFPNLDFVAYHREELPRLLAGGRGAEAGAAAQHVGALAIREPGGEAFTYVPRAGGVDIVAGDAAADTVIECDPVDWQGLVYELESAPGLLYGGRARCVRGNAMRLVAWEPALRAMYNGRPLFDPTAAHMQDRNGAPLDVERSFDPDDDREDMAHFLREAGYLHVRGVFDAEEVATFRACAAILRGEAVKGDRDSWWARNSGGEEVLCRVTRGASQAPLGALVADERITRLVALSDEPLAARGGEGGEASVTVIYKLPDVVEGLSNLPWHRDCGMGGHAVMCPILIVSVFLERSSPETGELRVLPGSWRGSCPYMDPADPRAPKGTPLATRAGDVSIHYGDLMHAAPAPTRNDLDAYRISATMAFAPVGASHHRGERAYNDVLLSRDDGQVEHLGDLAKRT